MGWNQFDESVDKILNNDRMRNPFARVTDPGEALEGCMNAEG